MNKYIKVKLQFEGFHNWPEAVDHPESYLAHRHRHMFHVTAVKEVLHGDREIEFVEFKREVGRHIENHFKGEFGTMSCEDIAEHLIEIFDLDQVEVMEDGENGAIIVR